MKFKDVYGKKHKTPWGALKADLKHTYAKGIRKIADRLIEEMEEQDTNYNLYGGSKVWSSKSEGFNAEDYVEHIRAFYEAYKDNMDPILKQLRAEAETGSPAAQLLLGNCYIYGYGVKNDNYEGSKLLKKAAEHGYAPAQMYYGLYLMKIDACAMEKFYPEIAAEGLWWVKKSAAQGYIKAQVYLGACYIKGFGVYLLQILEKDGIHAEEITSIEESLQIFKMVGMFEADIVEVFQGAAEQNCPDAQTAVGMCFLEDTGIQIFGEIFDESEDLTSDQREMVRKLQFKHSNEKAVEYFRDAAEQGYPVAQTYLGYCYLLGVGIEKNFNIGLEWLKKAANQGYDIAEQLRDAAMSSAVDYDFSEWPQTITEDFCEYLMGNKAAEWSIWGS